MLDHSLPSSLPSNTPSLNLPTSPLTRENTQVTHPHPYPYADPHTCADGVGPGGQARGKGAGECARDVAGRARESVAGRSHEGVGEGVRAREGTDAGERACEGVPGVTRGRARA